jgi:tetratricopeptide (TPR) repeat protein
MSYIGRIGLIGLSILFSQFARAEISADLADATNPLAESVPEVAVARLEKLLNKNLADPEWRAVAEKLAEAHVGAKQEEAALVLLTDPRLRELPWAKFWRAQAFASLRRWADALPLYEQLEADETSSFRKAATFGAAEMLRALGRLDEALTKFSALTHDKEWATRAQLRLAKLYIDKGDATNARRVLDDMQPESVGEEKERRLLGGRLELILRRPEKAMSLFEELLKKPENVPHATLIAALFGMVDAHVHLKTPDAGADLIEDFINRYPGDPDLSALFARLDELYRAERKPSRSDLEKWVRNPEQPRRTFARWYLARLEIRASRRDRARQLFRDVRRTSAKPAEVAGALLDFAQLEAEDRRFDEAIAILDDARLLHPDPPVVDQINLLAAKTQYLAK